MISIELPIYPNFGRLLVLCCFVLTSFICLSNLHAHLLLWAFKVLEFVLTLRTCFSFFEFYFKFTLQAHSLSSRGSSKSSSSTFSKMDFSGGSCILTSFLFVYFAGAFSIFLVRGIQSLLTCPRVKDLFYFFFKFW